MSADAGVTYTANGRDGFVCELITAQGSKIVITGKVADSEEESLEELTGDQPLLQNPVVVRNLLGYGLHENARRRSRNDQVRAAEERLAQGCLQVGRDTADLVDRAVGKPRLSRWCSSCLQRADHVHVPKAGKGAPLYLCGACGGVTTPCSAIGCEHHAVRRSGSYSVPRYCAEHRHDIPSFSKLNATLRSVEDYEEWLQFEAPNYARIAKISWLAAGGAVLVGPAALLAAPAIGGAIGVATGLSGAAATSHGLALLGGGAIAAGGLGMAGGTMVVTAAGTALGGALGATVASAYVGADKSFKIVRLRSGVGSPVLLASGFLTEKDTGWGGWRTLMDERYPDHPVYRVHWGSKELKSLQGLFGAAAGKQGAVAVGKWLAKSASKLAKVPGLSAIFAGADIAKNPWTVAKTRATMTGAALAGILSRVEDTSFVLVGHSLGGKVMLTAAEALGALPGKAKVQEVHLVGAAVRSTRDWSALSGRAEVNVWNYHSKRDKVLGNIFSTAEFGAKAIGAVGVPTQGPRIKNVDVSSKVASHSGYFTGISLAERPAGGSSSRA